MAEMVLQLNLGTTSLNAADAQRMGYLRATDVICYHPDQLLQTAKEIARTIEPLARPSWSEGVGPVAGMIDQTLEDFRAKGELTDYDLTIGSQLKAVFKASSYQEALAKERQEFEELLTHALTHARIKHTLETGKPLRN